MNLTKKLLYLPAAASMLFTACVKPDQLKRSDVTNVSDIYATIPGYGSKRLFEPVYSAAKDTVYFNIPYFYPVDSDVQTDLSKVIVRATIPTDATMLPMLGQPMDLSKPVPVSVTSGTGVKSSYTIVGRRVADLGLRKATISYTDAGGAQKLDAIVNDNGDAIFYVIPGTDVTHVAISYSLNPHSTGSIAQNTVLDLTQPAPFTVTGVDGSKKVYTFKALEPSRLNYGLGINRLVWQKKAADITGFTTNDNNRSMAVSGDYLILGISTSPSTYKVYNRNTGAYVQDMAAPPGNVRSFDVFNDSSGHILVATWAPKNSVFTIFKYNNVSDLSPTVLVQWTNNNPTAITADGGVGRRVNMYGDVTKNAVIMATAGQSTVTYRWTITNGVLASNTPDVLTYQSITGGTNWGFYAEAQPTSTTPGADYYVNYVGEVALVGGSSNSRSAAFTSETTVLGVNHVATDYFTFNNANYLAVVTFKNATNTTAGLTLFDVTNPSKIPLKTTDAGFSNFRVFASGQEMTANANGNGVADVCSTFSADHERVFVYALLTNGGIIAYEFTNYAP